MQVVRLLRGTN